MPQVAHTIIASFQPQAWVNDYAVDIDGAYDFDVTAQVLALGRTDALKIEDFSEEADALWRQSAVSDERQHLGPFSVTVEDAIREYFARADREDEARQE